MADRGCGRWVLRAADGTEIERSWVGRNTLDRMGRDHAPATLLKVTGDGEQPWRTYTPAPELSCGVRVTDHPLAKAAR